MQRHHNDISSMNIKPVSINLSDIVVQTNTQFLQVSVETDIRRDGRFNSGFLCIHFWIEQWKIY